MTARRDIPLAKWYAITASVARPANRAFGTIESVSSNAATDTVVQTGVLIPVAVIYRLGASLSRPPGSACACEFVTTSADTTAIVIARIHIPFTVRHPIIAGETFPTDFAIDAGVIIARGA